MYCPTLARDEITPPMSETQESLVARGPVGAASQILIEPQILSPACKTSAANADTSTAQPPALDMPPAKGAMVAGAAGGATVPAARVSLGVAGRAASTSSL